MSQTCEREVLKKNGEKTGKRRKNASRGGIAKKNRGHG